jgi:hypothetical protein
MGEPQSQRHEEITTMERETRRDRRARCELETLEGRKLMSAGSAPGMKPGQIERRQLLATDPQPAEIKSIPMAVRLSDHPPLRALTRVHKPAKRAITAVVTAGPDANGSVTISGRSYPGANVSLDLQADGTIEQTVKADAKGRFQFTFTVAFGSTPVRLSATAHGHRPTSTTLTVDCTQPPANLLVGTFGYTYSEYGGEIVTNQLWLTFEANGSGEIQYALRTDEDPFAPYNPFSPDPVQTDYWDWKGQWEVHGSQLEFVGQCMYTRTNTAEPSLDTQYNYNDDLLFPYYLLDQGKLYLTLADEFGTILSPNGPTRNIILSTIASA